MDRTEVEVNALWDDPRRVRLIMTNPKIAKSRAEMSDEINLESLRHDNFSLLHI